MLLHRSKIDVYIEISVFVGVISQVAEFAGLDAFAKLC